MQYMVLLWNMTRNTHVLARDYAECGFALEHDM